MRKYGSRGNRISPHPTSPPRGEEEQGKVKRGFVFTDILVVNLMNLRSHGLMREEVIGIPRPEWGVYRLTPLRERDRFFYSDCTKAFSLGSLGKTREWRAPG